MLQLEELSRPNVSLALNYTLRSFPAIAIRSIILALSDKIPDVHYRMLLS